uniref:Protein phosphatase 4 catalytic subunit n=1 Tax=Ornithorhynchus anatinus TaxID=9258 RepID=F7F3Q5_ORNAN
MAEISDLDRQIEQLRRCELIKESEVKALCAKARYAGTSTDNSMTSKSYLGWVETFLRPTTSSWGTSWTAASTVLRLFSCCWPSRCATLTASL